MTAGSGIVHSERTDPSLRSSGGLMHGMQAWVALPQKDEETDPAFAHHAADALPELSDRGIWARLIAGSAYGLTQWCADLFSAVLFARRTCRRRQHRDAYRSCRARSVCRVGRYYARGRATRARADAGVCRWRRTGNFRRGRAGARHAARWCQCRPALHMVEPGVVASRTDRAGKGRLEGRADGAAA